MCVLPLGVCFLLDDSLGFVMLFSLARAILRVAGLFTFVEAISMDDLGDSAAVPPADSEARCAVCIMSASYLCPVSAGFYFFGP